MNKLFMSTKKWLNLQNVKLDWFAKIWLLAPIFVWFSYQPVIGLGGNTTMNFELSLTLIYVVILALVGLPKIWENRKTLIKNRVVWLVGIFVLWQFLTLFWAVNLTRGVLTFGVVLLLFLIFLSSLAEAKNLKKILPNLVKIFIASAVVMSIFALIQMIAGIWLGRGTTLLCAGCVAAQFGFVRPNVFAIEPQFFGSLLLAPLLLTLHFLLNKKTNWRINLIFGFLFITLILTLSRGAIFAFIVGALVLFIISWKSWQKILRGVTVMFVGLALALCLQGFVAAINPNFHEKFSETVAKSVNQLSMGLIDFRNQNSTKNSSEKSSESEKTDQPAFDGYVPESTDTRVNLSKLALETWWQNPSRILFGVGLGGAGVAMANYSDKIDAHEIVQNEYVEILLERGVIGLLMFAAVIVGLVWTMRKEKWLWAIIAAFLLQWIFFSGLPNALHIYLILTLIFVSVQKVATRRGRVQPKLAQKS